MVDHAPPPAPVTLDLITAKRVELYRAVSTPGENIPLSMKPSHIDDSVHMEEEVKWSEGILRGSG